MARVRAWVLGFRVVLPGILILALVVWWVDAGPRRGHVDGPVLTSPAGPPTEGLDAAVGGTVGLVGDCLVLDPAEHRMPVVWPSGTWWDADRRAVVLPDGTAVPLGDTVAGGGGAVDVGVVQSVAGGEVAAAARTCLGPSGEVALFNVGSRVEVAGRP